MESGGSHEGLAPREWVISTCLSLIPIKHGKHRLLNLLGRWVRPDQPSRRRVRCGGTAIELDVSDLVGRHYLLLRSFDPEVVDVMAAMATGAGEVVWDIGANKGVFCYQMLERVPGLRMVAFEPQRDLAESVRANLEALGPGRHEVNAFALGDEPGESSLVIPLDNRGGASLHGDEAGADTRRERVEIVTAEAAVKSSRFGWPQLVKIDVEGHEPAVLRSLLTPLRAMAPKALVFEHHGGQDATFGEIFRQLAGCGYGVFAIEKSLRATTLRSLRWARSRATDFVAIRRTIIDPRREGTIRLDELRRAVAAEVLPADLPMPVAAAE